MAVTLTYNGTPAAQVIVETLTHKYHLADVVGMHTEVRTLYGSLGASIEFIDGANVVRVWLIPLHEIRMIRVEVSEPLLSKDETTTIEQQQQQQKTPA
jgi:hypothetical protein